MSHSAAVPNFFLVGASKAGTTSLYNYLDQHPQIFMSPVKEPHFLADEFRLEHFAPEMRAKVERWQIDFREYLRGPVSERFPSGPVSDWQDYLKLFQHAGDRMAIGEASPCYLWSKAAPQNIATRFPQAKIIMVLRDPAERAFAQHLHTLSFIAAPVTFADHMDAALRSANRQIGDLYPFLEFGLYGEQLSRYLRHFQRDKIAVYFYEDYQRNPRELLRNIFRFLEVDDTFQPDTSRRHMESRVPRSFSLNRLLRHPRIKTLARPPLRRLLLPVIFRRRATITMDPKDRSRLVDLYRSDIQTLSNLLNRNLSTWL